MTPPPPRCREVHRLRATGHDPSADGCAGCHPGCNPLIASSHHAERSRMPSARPVAVRVCDAGLAG